MDTLAEQEIGNAVFDEIVAAIESVRMYYYWMAPEDQIKALLPEAHESYVREKAKMCKLGFVEFLGWMDINTRRKYIALAMAKYMDESRERTRPTDDD